MAGQPEAWQRGPIEGVTPYLMPVAHALVQAGEDVARAGADLTPEELWVRPGGAAAIGFHLRHIAGVIYRLLTYARGEGLSEAQFAALKVEGEPGTPPADAATLVRGVQEAIAHALDVVRSTPQEALLEPRAVGRAKLPSNVLGLLYHIAEHAQRHTGQMITTKKIVRGLGRAGGGTGEG